MKIFEILSEQGELSVEKDDDKETVLVDKTKGTKTVIDKKNPNSPKLSQDPKGELSLQMDPKKAGEKKLPIPTGTKVKVAQ
jgi:hypothetical protein